jgi:hypothetical protein
MAIKLIVSEPFGDYAKGDEITDSRTVQKILDGDNALHVLAVTALDAPKPAKTTKDE